MSAEYLRPTCTWAVDPLNQATWRWRDAWSGGLATAPQPILPWLDRAPDEDPVDPLQRGRPGATPISIARHWADALVEALNGRRPYIQLAEHCDPTVLDTLRQHAPTCRAAGGAQLASVRVQAARPHDMEVCLRLLVAGRVRAVALGLTWREDHWHGEDLTIG
jgi:hypothetical protein